MAWYDGIVDAGSSVISGVGDLIGADGKVGWDGKDYGGSFSNLGSAWGTANGGVLSNVGDTLGLDGSFGFTGDDYSGSVNNLGRATGFWDSGSGEAGTDEGTGLYGPRRKQAQQVNKYGPRVTGNGGNSFVSTPLTDAYTSSNLGGNTLVNNGGNGSNSSMFSSMNEWLGGDAAKGLAGVAKGVAPVAAGYMQYQGQKKANKTLEAQLAYSRDRDKQGDRKRGLAQMGFAGGFN